MNRKNHYEGDIIFILSVLCTMYWCGWWSIAIGMALGTIWNVWRRNK